MHLVGIALLAAGGAYGLWQASRAQVGLVFLLYLLPVLPAVVLIPALAYRAYALWRAAYTFDREGVRLHWGLRTEDIPIDSIEWVRPAEDLETALPLPKWRLPGAVLGVRQVAGTAVEFMAARAYQLILIRTAERIYAISPANRDDFLKIYHDFAELGSLTPLQARSIHPTFLFSRFWADRPGRLLLGSGLLLSLTLLVWASLEIPGRSQVPLRLAPDGAPLEFVPAVRLLLLPLLNGFFYLVDLLLGFFFYRYAGSQPLAYLLWGSGVFTSLLFLGAMAFILHAG